VVLMVLMEWRSDTSMRMAEERYDDSSGMINLVRSVTAIALLVQELDFLTELFILRPPPPPPPPSSWPPPS